MRNDRLENRTDMLHRFVRPFGGPQPTEAEVEAAIERHLSNRGIRPTPAGARAAFVNDSRWLIECDCGAGVACSPALQHTTCPDCGARYDVVWPDVQVQARIEATLLERPARLPKTVDISRKIAARCWTPEQDIETLEAETAALKAALADDVAIKEVK